MVKHAYVLIAAIQLTFLGDKHACVLMRLN